MAQSVTLLGTGTCEIRADRMSTSALVELGNVSFVFDMGRGTTQRLSELALTNDDICHVLISHFHPDHVSDLIPFLQCGAWSRVDPRTQDLHIYGPPGIVKLVNGFYDLLSKEALVKDTYEVHVHELEAGTFFIEGHELEYVALPGSGNHGVIFTCNEKRYGLSGDATEVEPLIAFLKRVEVGVIDAGHLTDDEIVRAAAQSNTPTIICSHIYRELDLAALASVARNEGFSGELLVARDLLILE